MQHRNESGWDDGAYIAAHNAEAYKKQWDVKGRGGYVAPWSLRNWHEKLRSLGSGILGTASLLRIITFDFRD
jgi:hypothetical protein